VTLDCLLIADDFTGACDAAVHFALRGMRAVVPAGGPAPEDARVVALNTDSRDLEPDAVRRAIASAAAAGGGAARVFKKIDSTLRGAPGIEIAAALDGFHCDAAVVCPAYPQLHRVVEGGLLRVTGAPEFAPIDVAARIHPECAQTRPEGLAALLERGARMVSVDANCERDLDRIAETIFPMGRRILWAGSAGLAGALAHRFGGVRAARAAARGPALFCIGSDHPATLAQQEALLAGRPSRRVEDRASIQAALRRGEHAILRIPRGRISAAEVSDLISGAPAAALVLSGGDTASLVCRALEVQHVELCDEIVPGVPRGVLHGGGFSGIAVVTKSGGFGDLAALIHVADYFACPK
jgi:uncharacterized protein YgbK (DUF1537 family)